MSRHSFLFGVIVASSALSLPACGATEGGDEDIASVQQRDVIPPCGSCSYAMGTKHLDGTMNSNSSQAWPLTSMSLKLYSQSGGVLATITGLSPSSCYGGSSVAQTVSTTVTSGVARAELHWNDATGSPISQLITVNP